MKNEITSSLTITLSLAFFNAIILIFSVILGMSHLLSFESLLVILCYCSSFFAVLGIQLLYVRSLCKYDLEIPEEDKPVMPTASSFTQQPRQDTPGLRNFR